MIKSKGNKLFNVMLIILIIILTVVSYIAYRSYIDKTSKKVINNASKPQVTQDVKLISKEQITKKLSSENSLNCLSGEDEIKEKFGNDNISDEDLAMKWLKEMLVDRTLIADATFKYTFAYSLQNVDQDIEVKDNTVTININLDRLSLVQCELEEYNSVFTSDIGVLKSDFSPQELNVLNKRIKDSAKNTIQSDKEKRKQAIENVKSNIKALLQIVVNEDTEINFNVPSYDVVTQEDVEIVK